MKKRIVIVLVTGLMMVYLAGCGTKADATDQEVSESSSAETEADDEITSEEVVGDDTENKEAGDIEEQGIILFAEKDAKDFDALDAIEYKAFNGYIEADVYVPLFDKEGYFVGQIVPGTTISVTGMSTDMWARFENPIAGTDYDYLYVNSLQVDSDDFHYDAVKMKQGIEDYINHSVLDGDYTFLNEKASDMEVYEFRMDNEYQDKMDYEYWLAEQIVRNEEVNPLLYGTLYIECEEDTDGWIICRIYYKDLIESEY